MSITGHASAKMHSLKTFLLATMLGLVQLAGERTSRAVAQSAAIVDGLGLGLGEEAAEVAAKSRAHQTGTIIAGIVIGAAILIGLFVVATLNDALPAISNTELSNARNSTVSRIGDAMLLGSVVIIVLFAAVILRVLRGL